jgi:hypothetical protein
MIGAGAGGAVWPNANGAKAAHQIMRPIVRRSFITMSTDAAV